MRVEAPLSRQRLSPTPTVQFVLILQHAPIAQRLRPILVCWPMSHQSHESGRHCQAEAPVLARSDDAITPLDHVAPRQGVARFRTAELHRGTRYGGVVVVRDPAT